MSESQEPAPLTEPSVWDHFIAKLKFWDRQESVDALEEISAGTPGKIREEIAFPLADFCRVGAGPDRSTDP